MIKIAKRKEELMKAKGGNQGSVLEEEREVDQYWIRAIQAKISLLDRSR